MRSVIGTNPVTRAAAAFLVGGLTVLVVHQPVVGLLHALGSAPIMPYNLRATQPWGIPVFLSLTFWGGIWAIPIAWILDRLPRGWAYWTGAVVRHLSAKGSLAEQRRRVGRRRQRADRQRHLGSRFCVCMVSNICCCSVDGRDSDRAPAHPCMKILNVIAIRQSRSRPRRNRAEAKESHCRPFGCRPREGDR
jgi:hypothetical protein